MLDMSQIEEFFSIPLRSFKRNLLREYLQYKALEAIYDSPSGGSLVFMGGTAVHLLHGGPRFSEDLDFDNRGLSLSDFKSLAARLRQKMEWEGLPTEATVTARGAFRISLRFPGLLRRMGLSTDPREKVNLMIDAESQNFEYKPDTPLIHKFDVFTRIQATPPDLLLAQKVFCIFSRSRPMGRDFFDALFLWSKSEPRLDFLKSKLRIKSADDLKDRLTSRCLELDFKKMSEDVAPFLFDPKDSVRVRMFPQFVQEHAFTFE